MNAGDRFKVEDKAGYIEVIGADIDAPDEIHIVNETVSGLEAREVGGEYDGKILTWSRRPLKKMLRHDIISPLD